MSKSSPPNSYMKRSIAGQYSKWKLVKVKKK